MPRAIVKFYTTSVRSSDNLLDDELIDKTLNVK